MVLVFPGKTGDIMAMIERSEYEITGINMCTLNIEQAEKFHEVYKYVVPEYQVHFFIIYFCQFNLIYIIIDIHRQWYRNYVTDPASLLKSEVYLKWNLFQSFEN